MLFPINCEVLFQQNGAHAQTTKATIAWLHANIKHCIPPEDWLLNLPDLSPIENVWSIMTTAVYADPEPQSHASTEAPSSKCMEINFFVNTSKSYQFDALTTVVIKTMEMPFHTNSKVNMDIYIA